MHVWAATAVLWLALSLVDVRPAVLAETDYFPGLRKPPVMAPWTPYAQSERSYIIAQITGFIEEQARRRFEQNQRQIQHTQQILRQQQAEEYQQNRLQHLMHQHDGHSTPTHREASSSFNTFLYPSKVSGGAAAAASGTHDRIPFAVGPNDPRFYETAPFSENGDDTNSAASNTVDTQINSQNASPFVVDYQEMLAAGNPAALTAADAVSVVGQSDDNSAISTSDGVRAYKLKAPMEIIASAVGPRDDLNSLVQKLQSSGQASAIINSRDETAENGHGDVVRKQMDVNTVVDMYVVAIIAGISASVTVGLIAIGIGWYTLHKKSMAAADVEYPAYGVTGPNKDISPSGDRRLAQSAQMYHYQHQKQQIIAMESHAHNEHRNGSLTDAESDEENEEGDYTVYECPGLAPTGEMEVKNPLFLDDPTPATPANLTSNASNAVSEIANVKSAKK